jgi:hypothetical protein
MWQKKNDGKQPMTSKANISTCSTYIGAFLVDCCFLCSNKTYDCLLLHLFGEFFFAIVDLMVDCHCFDQEWFLAVVGYYFMYSGVPIVLYLLW